jgi:hypothetical protein
MEPYQLQVTGVFDFSPFILTNESEPTAVSLQQFSATATGSRLMIITAVLLIALLTTTPLILRRALRRQA